ncbi:uncharacterized protein LOC131997048 [Stomoxys calcitrans]|uniref:uncharacterized protein LOC131997048 n=1 Tax=Stomoxys calcitrans TaxID=35570 RepID=UPI0027E263E0|nr:uncharacterized protein LOC131997048 [Stomoxys calcitrans]
MMRLANFSMTLAMIAIAICEQQQQPQQQQNQVLEVEVHCHEQQQQQQQQQQRHEFPSQQQLLQQESHHNLSIMQNLDGHELPLLLQRVIAACCNIVRNYFALLSDGFMFSSHIEEERLRHDLHDFMRHVLICKKDFKVEIENISGDRMMTFNRKFNVIVVDSAKSLRELNPANLTKDYDIQEHYILYLMDAARFSDLYLELHQIFSHFWQYYMLNVIVLVENPDTQVVDVYTYFPFHDAASCRHVHVKYINAYGEAWRYPITKSLYPDKVGNLHKCPVTAAVWNTPPYLSFKRHPNGTIEIHYWEAELLYVLGDKFNFTVALIEPINNQQRGKQQPDGTINGAMGLMIRRTADLSLGSFRVTLERAAVLTGAESYYQTWQAYAFLKRAQPYTSLEILVYAFDNRTWICLVISFLTALLVAYFVQLRYDTSYWARIVMGIPRPTAPLTNIVMMMTGQAIGALPENTFCRFVLTLWDLFGLLLRTAYQSLLFQLLQSDLYHPAPFGLVDLMSRGCKIVTTNGTYDSVSTVPTFYLRLIEMHIIKNVSEQSIFFYVEAHKHECYAGISPEDFIIHHARVENKRGMFIVLPEKIFTQHLTIYFTKHTFLIDRFNEVLQNLRAMGLIDFWASNSVDRTYVEVPTEKQVFLPLTMGNLEGIFVTYLVLTALALVIFFVEIVISKWRK